MNRTFDETGMQVYDMAIFHGHFEKDKYNNEISKIVLPDYTYRMVHHSKREHRRQFATIYFGRDQFVKFCSFLPANPDMQEHTVDIITKVGTVSVSWGDGDCLTASFKCENPQGFVKDMKDQLDAYFYKEFFKSGKFVEDEVAVICFALQFISNDSFCLNKAEWYAMKEKLKAA